MSGATLNTIHPSIGVMWKTVSGDCNLACDYCYYSSCAGKPGSQIKRIESNLLEKFIKEYMANSHGAASFSWQGGEPLLAGLEFFERVVSLQASLAPPRTMISNALQTNATLLNDKWAAFFQKYQFLLGVSLDGPKEIHDTRRVDAKGHGSFERVMKGISYLHKHQVEFNVLTVVHKNNVHRAQDLMRFYKEHKFNFVQLIPCMDFRSQQVDDPGVYEITPQEYGNFLCEVFEHWYNEGKPSMSIRFFDNLLSVYVHREAELCTQRRSCPKTLVLEHNGDAFPCDFYIHPDWKLGSIGADTLEALLDSPIYDKFLKLKPRLPEKCKACSWKHLCNGGCPRNRCASSVDGAVGTDYVGTDYFCSSYQQLYSYAHERMKHLGDALRRQLFQSGVDAFYQGKPPGRNDLCACKSGRKYKHCCSG